MAMVYVRPAAYRRTYSPSQLAWSEGRRPLGTALHSSVEFQCYGAIEIDMVIIIIIIIRQVTD